MRDHSIRIVRFIALLVVAVLVAGLVPSAAIGAGIPLAGRVQAPLGGAYVGAYRNDAPFVPAAFDDYRKVAGERPAIVMWYQPWADSGRNGFYTSACVSCWRRGAIPMITWEPWDPHGDPKYLENPGTQPAYTLAKINSGAYDEYLHSWARAAKAARGPIMIRLMHEMNGSWYPWGRYANGNESWEFRAAWRRVVDIFRYEGATNVTWVWAPNEGGVNPATNPFKDYWPGKAYVDWVGLSGYNWGTTRTSSKWRSFETIYHGSLRWLRTYNKPIIVAEMASVPNGGDKAAWIKTTYARIKVHKEIKAVVYYDRQDVGLSGTQRWSIDSSAASVSAYRRAVASTYFKGSTPRTLKSWKSKLTPDQWAVLDSIPRTE